MTSNPNPNPNPNQVTNWESELTKKWIGASRLRQRGVDVIAVSEASKAEVVQMVRRLPNPNPTLDPDP